MALIEACKSNDTNSSIVDSYGRTTLIWACHYKMKEVALELIKTGHSNPEHNDIDGRTAFEWACEKDMEEVAYELVSIGTATIDDLRFLKPEWEP